jgi:hypothetical protein
MAKRISYARGFPYGAPLAMVRGGATRDPEVKDALKIAGFRWDHARKAWTTYMDRQDFGSVLRGLRDIFGCEVVPKADMDSNYIIDLDNPTFGRPQ